MEYETFLRYLRGKCNKIGPKTLAQLQPIPEEYGSNAGWCSSVAILCNLSDTF